MMIFAAFLNIVLIVCKDEKGEIKLALKRKEIVQWSLKPTERLKGKINFQCDVFNSF